VLGFVYLWVDRYTRRVAAGQAAPGNGIVRRLPSIEQLDRLTYRTIVFGFPVWTFGVIAGAIWADQAWGRYWGWDPVETWAFITWVLCTPGPPRAGAAAGLTTSSCWVSPA
jgi:ABC-type transport system involved in cytochrome c biogenesis permease subunit